MRGRQRERLERRIGNGTIVCGRDEERGAQIQIPVCLLQTAERDMLQSWRGMPGRRGGESNDDGVVFRVEPEEIVTEPPEALRSAPGPRVIRGLDDARLPDEARDIRLQRPALQEQLVGVVHLEPGVGGVQIQVGEQAIQRRHGRKRFNTQAGWRLLQEPVREDDIYERVAVDGDGHRRPSNGTARDRGDDGLVRPPERSALGVVPPALKTRGHTSRK